MLQLKMVFIFSVVFSVAFELHANNPDVSANLKIDTAQIRIGEQFGMNLSVSAPSGMKVFFPSLPDSIKKFDVVKRSKIDTLKSADGKITTLQQKLMLTCFDSGYYVIEPVTFYFQNAGKQDLDSVSTEAQLMTVKTIPVDTTKAIKDIKATLDVPLTFREILPYILLALAVAAIAVFAIYYLKKRKKIVPRALKKIPSRPAHEIALEELKKTETEKLWQQGFIKKYHSSVSDIIRQYIELRFSISAMEYTTDETLEHFNGNLINDDAKLKLKSILRLADMVKFAKLQPIAVENEQSLADAFSFVLLTKPATADDFKETDKEASS